MKEKRLKTFISWISFLLLILVVAFAIYLFNNVYFNIVYFIVAMVLMYLTSVDKPLNNYIYRKIHLQAVQISHKFLIWCWFHRMQHCRNVVCCMKPATMLKSSGHIQTGFLMSQKHRCSSQRLKKKKCVLTLKKARTHFLYWNRSAKHKATRSVICCIRVIRPCGTSQRWRRITLTKVN